MGILGHAAAEGRGHVGCRRLAAPECSCRYGTAAHCGACAPQAYRPARGREQSFHQQKEGGSEDGRKEKINCALVFICSRKIVPAVSTIPPSLSLIVAKKDLYPLARARTRVRESYANQPDLPGATLAEWAMGPPA